MFEGFCQSCGGPSEVKGYGHAFRVSLTIERVRLEGGERDNGPKIEPYGPPTEAKILVCEPCVLTKRVNVDLASIIITGGTRD